jgi:hypothetical protein
MSLLCVLFPERTDVLLIGFIVQYKRGKSMGVILKLFLAAFNICEGRGTLLEDRIKNFFLGPSSCLHAIVQRNIFVAILFFRSRLFASDRRRAMRASRKPFTAFSVTGPCGSPSEKSNPPSADDRAIPISAALSVGFRRLRRPALRRKPGSRRLPSPFRRERTRSAADRRG